MTHPAIVLCSAQPITAADGEVPEWLHLLPADVARTNDGRGPYRIPDAKALMAASLPQGAKLVLDENHATDLAAPKGGAAPARGWIVELQSRADGIWGRVEWTGEGRRLMADKAYRGVSPVILHRKDGAVTGILRASLTNTPNIIGLASIHMEERGMDWKAKLIELLGLDSGASDEEIAAALEKMKGGGDEAALQSALAPIAKLVGLSGSVTPQAVLTGVQGLVSGEDSTITALQSELADVTGKLNALSERTTRKDAEAFVDGAIRAGHVGVKPMRDRYITMHMADAAGTEALIGALPKVPGVTITGDLPRPRVDGELTAADRQVISLMGLDPEEYKKSLAASATQQEAL